MIRGFILVACLAGTASAQNSGSSVANQARQDREQSKNEALGEIFGEIFRTTTPTDQRKRYGGPIWRFAVSRSRGPIICFVTLHDERIGNDTTRYATPDLNCPADWRGVRKYDLHTRSGDLRLYDGASGAFWSGRSTGDQRYEGRARGSQSYELIYSQLGGASDAKRPDRSGERRYDDGFEPRALYGEWTMSQAGKGSGCRVEFPKPDPDAAFSKQNAVNAPAGCPGQVMFASQWFVTGEELKLSDNFNKVKATLRLTRRGDWEGETDRGEAIEMRR